MRPNLTREDIISEMIKHFDMYLCVNLEIYQVTLLHRHCIGRKLFELEPILQMKMCLADFRKDVLFRIDEAEIFVTSLEQKMKDLCPKS